MCGQTRECAPPMNATLEPPAPAAKAGKATSTLSPEQAGAQAERLLLTGKQLAARLGVSLRTVEQWSSTGVIPKLLLSARMTRYQLPKVLAALERYQTATLKK